MAACSSEPKGFDFGEGGIEVVFQQEHEHDPQLRPLVDLPEARRAIATVESRFEVEDLKRGRLLVRAPLHEPSPARREAAIAALRERAGDAVLRARWAGDRLYLRASRAIVRDDIARAIAPHGFEIADYQALENPDVGEIEIRVTVGGQAIVLERALEQHFPDLDFVPVSVELVGPQPRR